MSITCGECRGFHAYEQHYGVGRCRFEIPDGAGLPMWMKRAVSHFGNNVVTQDTDASDCDAFAKIAEGEA